VNRTKADVDIFWLDAAGERKPYGTARAGQEHQQHTFAGHVWLASDRQGKVLAVFEAIEEAGTAVIGGMVTATCIAVFIIPATFYFVEKLAHRKGGGKHEPLPTKEEV